MNDEYYEIPRDSPDFENRASEFGSPVYFAMEKSGPLQQRRDRL